MLPLRVAQLVLQHFLCSAPGAAHDGTGAAAARRRRGDDAAAFESTGIAATAHSDVHSAKCCKLAPCGLRDADAAEQ